MNNPTLFQLILNFSRFYLRNSFGDRSRTANLSHCPMVNRNFPKPYSSQFTTNQKGLCPFFNRTEAQNPARDKNFLKF